MLRISIPVFCIMHAVGCASLSRSCLGLAPDGTWSASSPPRPNISAKFVYKDSALPKLWFKNGVGDYALCVGCGESQPTVFSFQVASSEESESRITVRTCGPY